MIRVRETYKRTSKKSTTRASLELQVPQKSAWVFGDESTFHISGTVNRHNVRIWGTENRRAVVERVRDSHKVHVFVLYPVIRCTHVNFRAYFSNPVSISAMLLKLFFL
ncbi:hypothetical protein B7P43_G12853 [Cryptotermes secundus]|uniref:Tc1-like transposase DDE domain-containing protein n=1 Tax=Cryptotermes secundus TaxID=105785 RepID=A0A2J7Q1U7_9NEOP|nr:hypothetical protein B7P43_G12853 [Cryptotermes secundus]